MNDIVRFIADGDSVYDRGTRRYWYVGDKLNDGAIPWKETIRSVEKLNETRQAGHDSWRLPNIRELESLVDDGNHSPAFADGFFTINVKDGYWSSTTSLYEPRYAWVLYPLDGVIAGTAVEGVQTVGEVLAETIAGHGYAVFAWQEFESRIRGGQNSYSIRISEKPVNEYGITFSGEVHRYDGLPLSGPYIQENLQW